MEWNEKHEPSKNHNNTPPTSKPQELKKKKKERKIVHGYSSYKSGFKLYVVGVANHISWLTYVDTEIQGSIVNS